MNADKSSSVPNRCEQRFLPAGAHGRGVVGACLGQIPSGEEEECVVLTQIAIEHAPILRSYNIETVCPSKLCEFGFRERLPLVSSLYDIMLEPRGFAEKQNLEQFILVVVVGRAPTGPGGF
jgi:hypothetical protein